MVSKELRIAVVGPMGAGKTTLARRLAAGLGLPQHSLDQFYWRANWTPAPKSEFHRAVRDVTGEPAWVLDTISTATAADLLWARATVVVWLDLPRPLCAWRTARRSVGDIVRGRDLWAGNRDSVRKLFSARSAPLLAFRHQPRGRADIRRRFAALGPDVRRVRLTSRRAVRRFLAHGVERPTDVAVPW